MKHILCRVFSMSPATGVRASNLWPNQSIPPPTNEQYILKYTTIPKMYLEDAIIVNPRNWNFKGNPSAEIT